MSRRPARRRRHRGPSLPTSALAVVAVVAVIVAVAGCTSGPTTGDRLTEASGSAVAAVDAVAAAQSEVDGRMADLAGAVRGADETVRRLRAPASVDAALDDLDDARQELRDADPQAVDDALGTLGAATATAREAVETAATAAAEADDPWAVEYLAAESDLLTAVAAHADTGAALLADLTSHRDAASAALDDAADIAARRDDLGDAEATAAVMEVELRPALDDLIEAQEVTAAATEERAATASALNAASADAAAVAERRPSP